MGSNITVMGYDAVKGEWGMLNYSLPGMSGTEDWEENSFKVLVPENVKKVKMRLYASSPLDPDEGDAYTWFDRLSLYSMINYTTYPIMQIPIEVPETGRYFLLSEVLVSPTGGQIDVQIADVNSSIATRYPQQKWIWMEGELYLNKGTYVALVQSVEGTNSVRTMSLINETNYIEARYEVERTLDGNNIFISNSAASFFRENATIGTDSSNTKSLVFSDNGSAWTTLSIASEGDYKMSLYSSGSFILSVDGNPLQLVNDLEGVSVDTTIHLVPGSYNVSVNGTAGSALTSLWVYKVTDGTSLDQFREVHGYVNITVDRINSAHFRVLVSTDSPFMFCLPQSYDSDWRATIYKDGAVVKTISPVALYGCLNGFWVDETGGNITLEIKHTQQRLFDTGLAISSLALLTVGAIVLLEWRYGEGAIGRRASSMWSKIRRKRP
jgi:hypothetical protein